MPLSVDVPKINITPEAEEDDDHTLLNLSESLTDVEDLFEDDQQTNATPPIRNKNKLKIKLSSDGAATDLEDFEASSEDENDDTKLVKHEKPVLVTDLDLEAPVTEESYKRQAKSLKGKRRMKTEFATKQKSFYHSISEEDQSDDEGVVTDSEAYETENDDDLFETMMIPETDELNNLDLYKSDEHYLVAADNVPSSSVSAASDYSDNGSSLVNSVIHQPSYLQVSKACDEEDVGLTDTEVLRSESDTTDNEVKKTKIRRRHRHRAVQQRKSPLTDMEDFYFSDDDVADEAITCNKTTTHIRRQKRKPQHHHHFAKCNDSDYEDNNRKLPFPLCKLIAKKHPPVSLRIPEFDQNFQTDFEDIEGDQELANIEPFIDEAALEQKLKEISQGYSQVNEKHSNIEKRQSYNAMVVSTDINIDKVVDTDEDEFESDDDKDESFKDETTTTALYKIKFSPSNSNLKMSNATKNNNNLKLPLNIEDPSTDCENLESSPEESSLSTKKIPLALLQQQGQTDEEEFSDDDMSAAEFLLQEIQLPPPTRNLVLVQENDPCLVPTVRILPLNNSLQDVGPTETVPSVEVTDEESISDAEEALELLSVLNESTVRAPTPDLPILEGGSVIVQETINKMRNSCNNDKQRILKDELTDTEEVILDNTSQYRRRRAPKFKFMMFNKLSPSTINDKKASATDTEDILLSDDPNTKTISLLNLPQNQNAAAAVLTDTENIDFSEDDQDYSTVARPFSVTPQHLRELGGEILLLKEGSGPFSFIDKLELNKFTVKSPTCNFATPATTDSEDLNMASAEEDVVGHTRAGMTTPSYVHQELDQMCCSKTHSDCTKKFDHDEEVMYLKGGGFNDSETDVEYLMQDEEDFIAIQRRRREVEKVLFDFERFTVAFGYKEWDASRKPEEITAHTSPIIIGKDAAQQGEDYGQPSSSQQGASSAKAETEEVHEKQEQDKSKKVSDQHQLSDEMKELLKDMEKESKQ